MITYFSLDNLWSLLYEWKKNLISNLCVYSSENYKRSMTEEWASPHINFVIPRGYGRLGASRSLFCYSFFQFWASVDSQTRKWRQKHFQLMYHLIFGRFSTARSWRGVRFWSLIETDFNFSNFIKQRDLYNETSLHVALNRL